MLIDNLYKKKLFVTYYFVFIIIVVVNILTLDSPGTLIVTIPEYLIVLYTLFKGDIRHSVLFHFSFIMLSLSSQGTLGMFDSKDFSMYNYGTIKLVGPVRACYAMNILYCLVLMGKNRVLDKSLMFYKLFRIFLILCGSATIIGLLGLIINPYYSISSFIDYGIYAFVLVTSSFVLLKVANKQFIQSAYYLTLVSVMAGIAGCFFCYISGNVVSHYSVYDIAYTADVTMIALTLIVGIPFIKNKGLLWLSLVLYGILLLTSLGGKSVFGLAFALSTLAYLLFLDKKTTNSLQKSDRFLRPFVVIAVIGAGIYVVHHLTSDSMSGYKIASAASMFAGDLDSMSRSPYIRVASLINILNDGISNPFALLFGHGYGGYFEDKLGLFAGLDLSNGAWKDEVIASGRFTSGHDTMVTVPLFNGVLGLFLIVKVCCQYIKRIPHNYMNSIAFFWIFLMFYFNTIFAMIGLFGLIGAEYKLRDEG